MRYEFDVKEVSQAGCLSWEAEEATGSYSVKLLDPYKAGEYPEIEAELSQRHGFSGSLHYAPELGDEFDQGAQTWTFRRSGDEIVVRDIPRTVLRITQIS